MYRSILLPVDLGDEGSWRRSLDCAVDLASHWSAELHVVTVLPNFGMPVVGSFFPEDFEKNALAKMSSSLSDFVAEHVDSKVKVKSHVAHGTVYEQIIQAAEKLKSDLIVLGAHRPELKDYLLGPNAARVVRHGNCSVLVVRD